MHMSLADFLGSLLTSIFAQASPRDTFRFDSCADLPTQSISTPFNQLFRQLAELSFLRLHVSVHASN